MPIKYTLRQVKDKLKEKDLFMINEKYINSRTKFDIYDKEGYKYNISFNEYIQYNKQLDKFSKYNPYTIQNIKLWLKLNNCKNELLSGEYFKNSQKLIFTCEDCGEKYEVSFLEFRNRKRTKCKQCSGGYKKNKIYVETAIEILKGYNLEMLNVSEFTNSKSKINIKDSFNYKYYISLSDVILYNKEKCKIDKFSKFNPHTIYNIKLYLKLNNYKNQLLSTEYINCDTPLLFSCEECGQPFEVTFKHLRTSFQTRCKCCTKSESLLEKFVKQYLENCNINFTQQYKIDNCKDILPLPFDFAILNEENKLKYLIECDGKQHFEIIDYFGGEESYKYTKMHDDIKNTYCKNNNISLLRIPYWEFKNDNYINILNNKLYTQV
jgi:predicted nucleic acid-binding Zn ribbon protein